LSQQLNIATILSIAKICQYTDVVSVGSNIALKGGDINQRQPVLINIVRKSVQNRFNLNSSDFTLRDTANYLLSLLRQWPLAQNIFNKISAGIATISNPADQSINVGQSATFTVTVTSPTAYTVAWYRNGVIIPGATGLSYTLTNAQLTDSGAMFSAIATNAAGPVSSNTATLTVTALLTAQWWFGSTDPYAALSAGSDTLSYQINQTITHDAAITINYPIGAENNQFNVLRYPNTENQKTTWFNTNLNNGIIGDPQMRNILNINNFYYIVSRVAMSLDNVTTSLTYT